MPVVMKHPWIVEVAKGENAMSDKKDKVAKALEVADLQLYGAIGTLFIRMGAFAQSVLKFKNARQEAGVKQPQMLAEAKAICPERLRSKMMFYRWCRVAEGWEKIEAVPEKEREGWGIMQMTAFLADPNHGNSKEAKALAEWRDKVLRDKDAPDEEETEEAADDTNAAATAIKKPPKRRTGGGGRRTTGSGGGGASTLRLLKPGDDDQGDTKEGKPGVIRFCRKDIFDAAIDAKLKVEGDSATIAKFFNLVFAYYLANPGEILPKSTIVVE